MTYLKLAPYVVIAALVAAVLWYRGEMKGADAARDKASAELSLVRDANEKQAALIDQLACRKERDEQIVADISSKLAGINQTLADTSQAISGLEKDYESVRAYLASLVPDPLRRVLNRAESPPSASGH